jgi:hypothetical protein
MYSERKWSAAMKKSLVSIMVVALVFSTQTPASAANKTLKAGKAVSVVFPGSVTLKKSGCQYIPVKYTVGKMPELSFSYFMILDDSDSPLGSMGFYETPAFSAAKYSGKIWKKNGSFNLKICGNAWSEDVGDGEFQDYVGAKKGTYQIYLIVAEVAEEYSTITFK